MTAMAVSAAFVNFYILNVIFWEITYIKKHYKAKEIQSCSGKIASGQEITKGETTFTFR